MDLELIPYIFFNGNCREAMNFYKEVFGGELEVMEFKDAPADMPGMKDMEGKIMNASLRGGSIKINGCDSSKASPEAKKIELCVNGSNENKIRQIFDGLSSGGKVIRELKKEFWGDIFGQLEDKFGVLWMFNIAAAK